MFKFFIKQTPKWSVIAIALVFGAYCDGDAGGTDTSEEVFEGADYKCRGEDAPRHRVNRSYGRYGASLVFHAGGRRFEEFTPSHVREHMLQGLGVIVTYRKSDDDALYIVGIRDRPP